MTGPVCSIEECGMLEQGIQSKMEWAYEHNF